MTSEEIKALIVTEHKEMLLRDSDPEFFARVSGNIALLEIAYQLAVMNEREQLRARGFVTAMDMPKEGMPR